MVTTAATAIKEPEAEVSAVEREAPRIDPRQVKRNFDGVMVSREVWVRAPEDFTAADLADPSIWRRVQASPQSALRQFDRVVVIGFDETWLAEAYVADSMPDRAVLATPRIVKVAHDRFDKLYSDDTYRVQWNGAAYAIVRKADGHVMSEHATPELAVRAVERLYPKRVA
jgi:hypothetical protein